MIAGIINSFTAFLHIIGGQVDLVSPLQNSNLAIQVKAEWFGVWYMATIILFVTSFLLIKNFINCRKDENLKLVGYLYILFSIPFIISSFLNALLAPQWILLLPIGLLTIFGLKKYEIEHNK